MKKNLIVVQWWTDTPETKEIMGDVMLMLSPGLYYHHRLDTYILVKNDLPQGLAKFCS